jgi:purine-binding chemotaxis protein CheW
MEAGMAAAVASAVAGLAHGEMVELATFTVDEVTFALPLASVERVLAMVATTPLPAAPEVIVGVIGLGGQVIPVVNLRRRFQRRDREPAVEDRLLLVHSSRRRLALWVDDVCGIVAVPRRDIIGAAKLVPGIEHVQGVVVLGDGLVLIHDLDQCLSLEEEQRLNIAMSKELPD